MLDPVTSNATWASIVMMVVVILQGAVREWIAQRQHNRNMIDREAKAVQVVEAVHQEIKPVKQDVEIVKHQTNGGLTATVKDAIKEQLSGTNLVNTVNNAAEQRGYAAGGKAERDNPTPRK